MEYTVIFDMDGVLVDTPRIIEAALKDVLRHYKIRLTDEEIKSFLGTSLRDKLKAWKGEYGIDFNIIDFSNELWSKELELMANANADKEVLRLLRDLRAMGVRMGVGTSSTKQRAKEMLEKFKLGGYFSAVVTSEDVSEHKPSPHIFLEVAGKLGASPGHCVVIEDAPNGIEAAKNAGMKVIGYKTEYHTKEDLKNADLIISSFAELSFERIKELFG